MTLPELPPTDQGSTVIQRPLPVALRGTAGWAGYFLTIFSLLLPGYSIILIQLRWHIHDGGLTGFVVFLLVLYVAFFTALAHTWRLTRRFPWRGAVALVMSLVLLPQVAHFMLTIP
ncbi:MAG: hypothetical protein ACO1QR_16935 [Chthoniobacteraceae bacterium]